MTNRTHSKCNSVSRQPGRHVLSPDGKIIVQHFISALATSCMAVVSFPTSAEAELRVHSQHEHDILSGDKVKTIASTAVLLWVRAAAGRKPPGSSGGSWLSRTTAMLYTKRFVIPFSSFSHGLLYSCSNPAHQLFQSEVCLTQQQVQTFPWIIHLEGVDALHVCSFRRFDLLSFDRSFFPVPSWVTLCCLCAVLTLQKWMCSSQKQHKSHEIIVTPTDYIRET